MRFFQTATLPSAFLLAAIFVACNSDDPLPLQGDAGHPDSASGNAPDAAPADASVDASDANGDGGKTDGGPTGPATCGNGRIEGSEVCDDGNIHPSDGCSIQCTVEPGWICTGEPSRCSHIR